MTRYATADSGPEVHARRPPVHSRRKQSILRAAVALFRERGYHGTSIRDIGSAAGVTSAALYRHFANKDQILETAIWQFARNLNAASRAAVEGKSLPPNETLRTLVRTCVDFTLEERDLVAAYLFEARHLDPKAYAELRSSELEYRDLWVHHLRLARPELTETRTRTMVRAALVMVAHACVEDPEIDSRQIADLVTDMAVVAMLEGG